MIKEEKKESKTSSQVTLRVEGKQFYSNESSINFNPNEVILDFKCVTHTHDLGDKRSLILKHNLVILNPYHAKNFLGILNNVVKEYEARFGEIKKSDSMKKAEKMVKKQQKKIEEKKEEKEQESYFG